MTDRYDDTLRADDALRSVSPGPVLYDPMHGNNGDDLIRLGCERAIELCGLDRTTDPALAAAIVITGGGGMNDFSTKGLETLHGHLRASPEKPLIVLPQSYLFEETDFAGFFGGRRAPVYLFARERVSLDILRGLAFPDSVRVGLDHDMAFRLEDSPFVESLRARASEEHALIVERGDAESVTGTRHTAIGVKPINRLIPSSVKLAIKRRLRAVSDRTQGAQTAFASSMLAHAEALVPGAASLPVVAGDVSDPNTASFERFCDVIARAKVVCTNRLHVGVLAAMVGKPTLLRSGSYHKIRGIYELSMAARERVQLVDD